MENEILERAKEFLRRNDKIRGPNSVILYNVSVGDFVDRLVKFAASEVARREKEIGNDLFALPGDMSFVLGMWEYVQDLRAKADREE